MSELINIDEANYDYVTGTFDCHDADKTPVTMYLSISNCIRGDTWVSADPDPPAGIFILTRVSPIEWKLVGPDFDFIYRFDVAMSILMVDIPGGVTAFLGFGALCGFQASNSIDTAPGNKYYLGEAEVTWVEPPKARSLAELCDDLNIPKDGLTDALSFPIAPDSEVVTLLRGVDQIKISIRRIIS